MTAIEVNGEPCAVPAGSTLAQLVESLGLAGQAIALAVNRCVVPRGAWPDISCAPGDRIDIVRAIGGG